MRYHVNVSWIVTDFIEVEATSADAAREVVKAVVGLPNNQRTYLDDSFNIDGVYEA